jgi:hypothetical protein
VWRVARFVFNYQEVSLGWLGLGFISLFPRGIFLAQSPSTTKKKISREALFRPK